ncbi:MAG: 1-phosphofructokinase family hexose kinase [Atribacterota bacterium]
MILTVTPNPCLDRTLFVREHKTSGNIEVERIQEIAGGKGSNVCRVLRELGSETIHLLFLGGYVGRQVLTLLEKEGIESAPVWMEAPTRVVTTVVDRNWHQLVYFEPPPYVTENEEIAFLSRFRELGERVDMVLLCGSVPPSLLDFYEKILVLSQNRRVLIDGRGRLLRTLLRYPFGLKMNREEAEVTWGQPLHSEDDWQQFFNFFFGQGVRIFLLTLGQKGALLGTPEGFYGAIPPQVETINPVGSGDAFLAAFAHVFCNTLSLEDALRWAVVAGASNAMVWEAGRVDRVWVTEHQKTVKVMKSTRLYHFQDFLKL